MLAKMYAEVKQDIVFVQEPCSQDKPNQILYVEIKADWLMDRFNAEESESSRIGVGVSPKSNCVICNRVSDRIFRFKVMNVIKICMHSGSMRQE